MKLDEPIVLAFLALISEKFDNFILQNVVIRSVTPDGADKNVSGLAMVFTIHSSIVVAAHGQLRLSMVFSDLISCRSTLALLDMSPQEVFKLIRECPQIAMIIGAWSSKLSPSTFFLMNNCLNIIIKTYSRSSSPVLEGM